jgi:hypothetical protein
MAEVAGSSKHQSFLPHTGDVQLFPHNSTIISVLHIGAL